MILELALLSGLALAGGEGIQHFQGNFEEAVAKAKTEKKPVFIDFYTDWCGWCKVLDKTTFMDASVVALMNKSYINLKIDAEKGEGPEVAKKFGVQGFPTLVVVDGEGKEVDRIGGYVKPEEFLETTKGFLAGNNYQQLQREIAKSPNDAKVQYSLATRLFKRDSMPEAKELFDKVVAADKEGKNEFTIHSKRQLALINLMTTQSANDLIDFAKQYPDPKYSLDAHRYLVQIYQQADNNEAAEASFDFLIKNDKPSADLYATFSRFLTDSERSADKALEFATKATELAPKEPFIVMTLAEAQFRLKQYDKATASAQKAIDLVENPKTKAKLQDRLKEMQTAAGAGAK